MLNEKIKGFIGSLNLEVLNLNVGLVVDILSFLSN